MKQIAIIITLFCSLFGVYHKASAFTLYLPVSKSTQYWNVTLDKPEVQGSGSKLKKEVYKEYSLTVKPLKKGLQDVEIEMYRDDKTDLDKLYEIVSSKYTPSQHPFVFQNLPVANKAQNLYVQITWKEKSNGRKFQQTVFFKGQKTS